MLAKKPSVAAVTCTSGQCCRKKWFIAPLAFCKNTQVFSYCVREPGLIPTRMMENQEVRTLLIFYHPQHKENI